jgi:hypothetical protein
MTRRLRQARAATLVLTLIIIGVRHGLPVMDWKLLDPVVG